MINLNTDKGIVRLAAWEDVLTHPGFEIDIDPKAVTLKAIIGNYEFTYLVPCGLSTCHQPHGKGYLVELSGGRVTNIGSVCGKRYFAVEFVSMRRAFDREMLDKERREALHVVSNRRAGFIQQVVELKQGESGASALHGHVQCLLGTSGNLPASIVTRLRDMARVGSNALTRQRVATQAERDNLRQTIIGRDGTSRTVAGPNFVDEQFATLAGIAALQPGNSIRKLLVDAIEPALRAVDGVDIDSLSSKQLAALHRMTQNIDADMERLQNAIAIARELLTESNLAQLSAYVKPGPELRSLTDFVKALPKRKEAA